MMNASAKAAYRTADSMSIAAIDVYGDLCPLPMTARIRSRITISFPTIHSVREMVSEMEELQNMSAKLTLDAAHSEFPGCEMSTRMMIEETSIYFQQ